MAGSRMFYAFIVFLAGFIGPVIAQCDGAATLITGGTGEIQSPNRNIGGEYGKSANCTWEFSPPSDGKEYVLRITVERLRLFVVKEGKKHCLGSYNLAINNGKTSCGRYVHGLITESHVSATPANYFCNSYYSSSACSNVREIQGCETRQQTSYPVNVRYDSDGRTDPEVSGTSIYFSIRYELIECPKEESMAATSISQNSTSLHSTTSAPEQAATSQESDTSALHMKMPTSPMTGLLGTSPVPTSTIILSVVVAVLVLLLAAAGVFIWKRIFAKKPQTTNKTGQQESRDDIYDNNPSPSNQENRAYEEITDKSANVEEDPYITPNATPTGGEYEIPIQLAARQYENVP